MFEKILDQEIEVLIGVSSIVSKRDESYKKFLRHEISLSRWDLICWLINVHIRRGRVFGTPQNDDVTHIAGSQPFHEPAGDSEPAT